MAATLASHAGMGQPCAGSLLMGSGINPNATTSLFQCTRSAAAQGQLVRSISSLSNQPADLVRTNSTGAPAVLRRILTSNQDDVIQHGSFMSQPIHLHRSVSLRSPTGPVCGVASSLLATKSLGPLSPESVLTSPTRSVASTQPMQLMRTSSRNSASVSSPRLMQTVSEESAKAQRRPASARSLVRLPTAALQTPPEVQIVASSAIPVTLGMAREAAQQKGRKIPARLQAIDDLTRIPRPIFDKMLALGGEARAPLGYGQHRVVYTGEGGAPVLRQYALVGRH